MTIFQAAARVLFAALAVGAMAQPAWAQAAPAAAPSASPSPQPTPVPAASPAVSWSGVISGYTLSTRGIKPSGALDTPTGADVVSRADASNMLFSAQRNSGTFRFGATIGEYAFPVVGQPLNPTFHAGANTDLYGLAPIAYVQLVLNDHLTLSIGKLATLLGQESGFTYQNVNLQHGLAWNAEPVISRGVRAQYTSGPFTGALEYNDGFYSGNHRALAGSVAWAASAASTAAFVFIVPDADTPANPTAAVANKREYNLMYTGQFGKLSLTPYLLWAQSPKSVPLGFAKDESASFVSLLGSFAFTPAFSIGTRYEIATNNSSTSDPGLNADFLGYGAGSSATTFTLTPTYKFRTGFVRAEWSQVVASHAAPGLGFDFSGASTSQSRFGIELALQF